MFHLSQVKINSTIWTPRQPRQETEMDWRDYNEHVFFEPPIPRICVSPTINRCLLGMGMFIDNPEQWNDLYVYQPGPCKLIPANGVHDAHLTQEHLITKPVRMDYVTKVKVRAKETIKFRWFDYGCDCNRIDFEIRY